MQPNNEPNTLWGTSEVNQIPVSPATPVEPTEPAPTQPKPQPKKVSNPIYYLLVICGGVVLLLWLIGSQQQTPLTAQANTPTPIATGWEVEITRTVTPTRPTSTPIVLFATVIFPTRPTPAPTATPTPTFEPLSDKPIMGYVFSPPKEITNTRDSVGYYEIVDWLPNSSEEILVQGPLSFKTINIFNGQVKQYATFNVPGEDRPLVWLTDVKGVVYLAIDTQTRQVNLWLGQADKKEPTLLLADVTVPFISVNKGKGVAVYHKPSQTMQVISPDKLNLRPVPQPIDFTFPNLKIHKQMYTTYQPQGDWVAYYGVEGLQLVNTKSKEIRLIDLGGNKNELLWPKEVKWSPDGKKMALVLIQGRGMYDSSDLYILDWPTGALHKVEDKFTFISDIAWTPDSSHILFKAVINQKDGFNINALYITNISIPLEIVPVPIPIEGLTSFNGAVSLLANGKMALIVQYFDNHSNNHEVALYRIDVTVSK